MTRSMPAVNRFSPFCPICLTMYEIFKDTDFHEDLPLVFSDQRIIIKDFYGKIGGFKSVSVLMP